MGFTVSLNKIFAFTYQASFDNGLTEYEFDHVFAGIYDGPVAPDAGEVNDYAYRSITEIEAAICLQPAQFTAWFIIAFPLVEKWAKEQSFFTQHA